MRIAFGEDWPGRTNERQEGLDAHRHCCDERPAEHPRARMAPICSPKTRRWRGSMFHESVHRPLLAEVLACLPPTALERRMGDSPEAPSRAPRALEPTGAALLAVARWPSNGPAAPSPNGLMTAAPTPARRSGSLMKVVVLAVAQVYSNEGVVPLPNGFVTAARALAVYAGVAGSAGAPRRAGGHLPGVATSSAPATTSLCPSREKSEGPHAFGARTSAPRTWRRRCSIFLCAPSTSLSLSVRSSAW